MNRNDIITRKFAHAFFGYDVEDVDLFLDEIIREFDRIHNELEIAELKADAAKQREMRVKRYASQLLADAGINVDESELFADETLFADMSEEQSEQQEEAKEDRQEDQPIEQQSAIEAKPEEEEEGAAENESEGASEN